MLAVRGAAVRMSSTSAKDEKYDCRHCPTSLRAYSSGTTVRTITHIHERSTDVRYVVDVETRVSHESEIGYDQQ